MTLSRVHFLSIHKRTVFALLFGLSFSVIVAYATPPTSPYVPGETLDPDCAPGDAFCTVSISPILTFSTGLTNTTNTITNNLSTGISGGQSIVGGTGASETLTLSSTTHATKGKIVFGTSTYDEANNRLGIGLTSPDQRFVVQGQNVGNTASYLRFDSGVLSLEGDMSTQSGVPVIDFKDVFAGTVMSRFGYIDNLGISISNSFIGLNKKAVFIDHGVDENSFMITKGIAAYGIPTRIGIGTANPSSRLDVTTDGLNETQLVAAGISMVNHANAVNTVQQISPAIRWSGHGWKTDAVAGSQDVDFRAYVTPVQGTANPTGYLGFGSSINGAAYTDNQLVLTSAGYVGIGTTTPGYLLHVGSASVVTGTAVARFENAGGTCTVTPSTAAGITCTSDERLKKNITTMDNTILDKILSLHLVTYNLLPEADTDQVHAGVIAQELEGIFPDLVQTDSRGYKSVAYAGLVPYTIKAIQEMDFHITELNNFDTANPLRESLIAWFSNATNHITRIFTGEICLTDTDGTSECLNKQQLGQLKQLLTPQTPPVIVNTDPDTNIEIEPDPLPPADPIISEPPAEVVPTEVPQDTPQS